MSDSKKVGFIKLHRAIQESLLYPKKREFTEFEAWVDILLTANYVDTKIKIGNEVIVCQRGQCINSHETWAKRWRWNKSKVRRFLELLKSEEMIDTENVKKTTRLTVCKYEDYQGIRINNESIMNQSRIDSESMRDQKPTHLSGSKRASCEQNEIDSESMRDQKPTPIKEEEEERKKKIHVDFSVFWELYDKKVGDKAKLEKKWGDLSNDDRIAILRYIPLYVKAQPDKQYRKDPATFLNNKSWNDELINKVVEMPVVHRQRKLVM